MPQASVLLSYSDLTAVIYQVKHRLNAPTLIRKFDISLWYPCGAHGRAYGHVITKISRVRHLHISHNAPFLSSLPPQKKQILNNPCFSFLLGITTVPREIENNAHAKLGGGEGGEGANKVHCGKWRMDRLPNFLRYGVPRRARVELRYSLLN